VKGVEVKTLEPSILESSNPSFVRTGPRFTEGNHFLSKKIEKEKIMKKLLMVCLVVTVSWLFVSGLMASEAKEKAEKGAQGEKQHKVVTAQTVTVTATVEAIDQGTRMVTLKGPDGKSFTFRADERVKNLPQVKVGDKVKVKYFEALAVEVKKPGETKAGAAAMETLATAKPGEKPAAVGTRTETMTATVEAIDLKKNHLTLKGPDGKLVTVKARDPRNLKKVKVGDELLITYTEALAIAVQPAGKKEEKK
jgi:hypothetical protein